MPKSMAQKSKHIIGQGLLLIVVLAVIFFVPARAQEAGGTIEGTVVDATGGVVTSANITFRNVATGVERTVVTNDDGFYVAPNLTPGIYEVRIEAAGFVPTIVMDVTLNVGQRREINTSLKVGSNNEKVTVTGDQIADVQVASSALGNIVDSHTVVDLPLNGRDWTSLTLLESGVAQIRTQKALGIGNDRPNRGLGVDITIGGNRPQGNNYRLDGVSINDYSSGAPGSITGGVLGVDAVREFSVVRSNAPADYGKTSGGVINAASRTGTNSFHGAAYEFLRNNALDARNFFDKLKDSSGKLIVPPFRRNQFGGSAGGPIVPNRTFFFADYEGLRQSLNTTNTITVPSANARSGHLVAGTVTVDPKVAPYLACTASSCLFPLPNGTVSGDTGIYSFASKQPTTEDFVTARVDHKLSSSDSLFGTYVFDKAQISNPDAYNIKINGNQSRRHTVALEESHIFTPVLLNTARFGFNRDVVIANSTLSAINPAAADPTFGFDPGRPVGIITAGSGVTQFSGGIGAISEYDFHYNSFQFSDDLFWTRETHSLKFGFYAEWIQSNQFTRGSSPNGFFTFGGLSQFLQNRPSSFVTRLGASFTPRDLRQTIYSGYVQDDYKLRRNLTLNLGLRYEMSTVPTETANQLATLVNLNDSRPRIGSPYFSNPTFRNFAPRVGFSWDPFKNGKTSIRGAFGMYDVLPLSYQFELLTLLSAPFTEGGSVSAGPNPAVNLQPGDFPGGAYSKAALPAKLRYGYVEQNPHRSYVQQWNLNVQRELFPSFTLTVGYVGSHGIHLPSHTDDINDFQPTGLTPAGYLWPAVVGSGSRLFTSPSVQGQVSANTWSAASSYHGLNVETIKRLTHGFQIQGSYTFAKSIDTSSSGIAGDTFGNSVSSLPFFDPRLRRGLSDFDVRHVLAINALWMIPSPKSWHAVPGWFVSGWQAGGIFSLSSGLPFTPTIGGDPLGLGSADNYAFPNRVAGCNPVDSNFKQDGLHYINLSCFSLPVETSAIAGECRRFGTIAGTCANLLGNSGRNTVVGPGLKDMDFSLFKNNPVRKISETFNVQFRWEIFNIANHANFAPPAPAARQIFAASGVLNNAGLLNATSTTSRQMQFALKIIW